MKTETTHTDCLSCDYNLTCFWLLQLTHKMVKNCRQGRKSAVRVRAKDQKDLIP